jgi:type I restriction enzyme S subunit
MTLSQTLADFANIESGFSFKSSDWLESGWPVVKIKNIQDGIVSLEGCGFVSEEVAAKATGAGFKAEGGDILISLTGYVGQVGRVKEGDQVLVNQRVGFVKAHDPTEQSFVYYTLLNFRNQIEELATGTAQANVSPKDILKLLLPNVSRDHRLKAAKMLENLDKKIAINREISKTLEGIAQTVFKSWFIDFDPVKAKAAGENPLGMDDATASLFPGSMENVDGEEIPAGWRLGAVSDICDSVVNGSTPLRSNSDFWKEAEFSWFKTGELADNFLFESKESISSIALKQTSVKTLPEGSVLMAIYAAPTVGRLGILTRESTFNQACTGMVPKVEFGTAYLYLTLFNRRVWFNSLAIGAAQQNISKGIVENCPVVMAPVAVHEKFRRVTDPIFSKIQLLSAQNITLERIRDSLLPRFLSGELQVTDEMLVS